MASYLYTYGVYSGAGLLDNCNATYIVFWKLVLNQNYNAKSSFLFYVFIITDLLLQFIFKITWITNISKTQIYHKYFLHSSKT